MFSERVDTHNWLVIDKELIPYATFIVTKYPAAGNTQVVISRMSTGSEYSPFLEVSAEIYSTTGWAADSDKFVEDVIKAFKSCSDQANPIELVYQFGGTMRNREVVIAKRSELH